MDRESVLEFSGDLDLETRKVLYLLNLFVAETRGRGLKNKDIENCLRQLSGIEAHSLRREITDRILEGLEIGPVVPTFSLLVPYRWTIEDLLEKGNFLMWHLSLTSKNFKTSQTNPQPITIHLIHPGKSTRKEGVWGRLEEMSVFNWRPAELRELLTLGSLHPWLSDKFPIVTFDPIRSWCGRRLYPFIFERVVNLMSEGPLGFNKDTRFAFVTES